MNEEYHPDEDSEEPNPTAVYAAVLPSGETVTRSFSKQDAINAGLWGGSDPWKKYPRRMLQMRARGWCLRDAVPHLLAGVYAEGELIDITPDNANG